MSFLDQPPRFLFFTGKGDVGKTLIACATAIKLAEADKLTLLVSIAPPPTSGKYLALATTLLPYHD